MRPLHSIVCLLDGKVVPFAIEEVEAGCETRGHRFHGNAPFEVSGAADYVKALKAHKVILDPADYGAWLDPTRGGLELLRPCPEAWLEAVPVSTRVNSPRNDDPSILQPEGEALQAQDTLI